MRKISLLCLLASSAVCGGMNANASCKLREGSCKFHITGHGITGDATFKMIDPTKGCGDPNNLVIHKPWIEEDLEDCATNK